MTIISMYEKNISLIFSIIFCLILLKQISGFKKSLDNFVFQKMINCPNKHNVFSKNLYILQINYTYKPNLRKWHILLDLKDILISKILVSKKNYKKILKAKWL